MNRLGREVFWEDMDVGLLRRRNLLSSIARRKGLALCYYVDESNPSFTSCTGVRGTNNRRRNYVHVVYIYGTRISAFQSVIASR